jgi:hypothetical protein
MSAAPGSARSFVVSMSLTELAFILFFLLLLLALARDMVRREEIEELGSANRELSTQAEAWSSLSETLRQQQILPEALSDDFFAKLTRDAAAASALREQNAELTSQLREEAAGRSAAEELAASADSRREEIGRQLSLLGSQAGVGFPPCWVSADNEIEYIYRITIGEKDLSVAAAWPASRARDAARIPRAREMLGSGLSLDQFSRPASSVLAWSLSSDPECRHYVILVDRAQSKDGYKKKRLYIENFFYKLESRL